METGRAGTLMTSYAIQLTLEPCPLGSPSERRIMELMLVPELIISSRTNGTNVQSQLK